MYLCPMRVVFMGTPEFAVATAQKLLDTGFTIVGVVTAPDRPAGRGRQEQASPVKTWAVQNNLPVLQPEKLKDPGFLQALEVFRADIFVVVAFRMLPDVVWQMPPKGTLNLHASLLPDYRGAAPVNRVIMNGEKRTGVTTFFIEKEIDTGNILMQKAVDIPEDWNAGQLHNQLKEIGAKLVCETLFALESGSVAPKPQDDSLALHAAPKIFKEDMRLDFNCEAKDVFNQIRGLSPYPGAWCYAEDKILKIYAVKWAKDESETPVPGKVKIHNDVIRVSASDAWLEIEQLQLEGRKKLNVNEFLRGYTLPPVLN